MVKTEPKGGRWEPSSPRRVSSSCHSQTTSICGVLRHQRVKPRRTQPGTPDLTGGSPCHHWAPPCGLPASPPPPQGRSREEKGRRAPLPASHQGAQAMGTKKATSNPTRRGPGHTSTSAVDRGRHDGWKSGHTSQKRERPENPGKKGSLKVGTLGKRYQLLSVNLGGKPRVGGRAEGKVRARDEPTLTEQPRATRERLGGLTGSTARSRQRDTLPLGWGWGGGRRCRAEEKPK